ncbi:hypothetical protein [Streptomyces sp. NPDC002044]
MAHDELVLADRRPRVGAVAATLAGWVLVLVLLDAYLPGAAG